LLSKADGHDIYAYRTVAHTETLLIPLLSVFCGEVDSPYSADCFLALYGMVFLFLRSCFIVNQSTNANLHADEHNVGQLAREHFGKASTFNIGFTTHTGQKCFLIRSLSIYISSHIERERERERERYKYWQEICCPLSQLDPFS